MSPYLCREKPITPMSGGYGVTSDELDEAIDRIIQQSHCKRLEAATSGRLTFTGDRIVRRSF